MTQHSSLVADDMLVLARCPNCGAEAASLYCGACGQKRVDEADLTVRHFLRHLAHEITEVESNKIVETLVALVFHPGRLTVEYLAGRKGRYVEPIRLYLSISAVFFLFAWGAHLDRNGYYERTPKAFAPIARVTGLEVHDVVAEMSHKQERYSAVTRFASVLGSGLALALLFRGTRRYYFHHLIFALHYTSFFNLLSILYALMFAVLRLLHVSWTPINHTSTLVLLIYGYLAMRTVYRQPRAATALKTAAFVAIDTVLFMAAVIFAGIAAAVVVMLPVITKL